MRTLQTRNPNSSIHNLNSFKKNITFSYYYSETFEEFQKRQRDYDKLQKYPYHTRQKPKNLNKYNYSKAAKEIKQQFFQTRANLKEYIYFKDHHLQQQKRSIQTIVDILRQQKKVLQDKKVISEQKQRQFNLMLILMIIIPILCVMTVLTELL
ncbi:unnamed protein product [Paramecium octaurelia]|uniref:Transmembrane protein n=1 Tax=Paramecium octaurelia TaxID=43137 RepID=A0A8S1W6W5_PAROT|nr:unnamed protein product [Paramecium octaurelia]